MSLAEPALITIRESLEAFLLISIFAGLVTKLGAPKAKKYLVWGAAAALAAAILTGAVIDRTIRQFFHDTGTASIFGGIAGLVAVGILTYMVIWMYRHTLEFVAGLRGKTQRALAAGRPGLLFTVAFVAVAREGLETVFFFASLAPSTGAMTLIIGLLLGLAVSAALAFFVFTGIVRLNIKRFFAATGILLIFFAGGLLMMALRELTEVGWVPATKIAWDTSRLLDEQSLVGQLAKAVFGYRESPTILEASAYTLYVVGMGAWYILGLLRRRRAVAEPRPDAEPATAKPAAA
jgi:high-affinity iron transporter